MLGRYCRDARVAVWAWALMPNHVHLILVPADMGGLRRALAPLHGRYAGYVHAREHQTGHFWQGRFGCVAMDEAHLAAALRYVVLNPVRARLVERATDWRWSSVHAQLGTIADDGVTCTAPVRERFPDFAAFLAQGEDLELSNHIRRAETIGRPVGSPEFIAECERLTGRTLAPAKRGPKPGSHHKPRTEPG
jgi:putative transposase